MKLELKEFVDATRAMHERSGVKKTKLMLHLRPFHKRNTFRVKSTDGQVTFTSRVVHQGQLKVLEGLVNQFVQRCTSAIMQPTVNTSTATLNVSNTNMQPPFQQQQQMKKNEKFQQQQQQREKAAKGSNVTTSTASQQQQQQQQKSEKQQGNKQNSTSSSNKRGGGGGHHKRGQKKENK